LKLHFETFGEESTTMPRLLTVKTLSLLLLSGYLGFSAIAVSMGKDPKATTPDQPGLVMQEFVYDDASFPSCHASTIAETPEGLVCAFFGGTAEKNPDVEIWLSRNEGNGWTAPVSVANGVKNASKRWPCWNPVLFQTKPGTLLLFYKVGPNPSEWWGMLKVSHDNGKTWGPAKRLPDGFVGPVKNKPFLLADGTLLCPASTEHNGWQLQMEWTPDLGNTWHRTGPLNDGKIIGAIQPSVLRYGDRLQILCRSKGGKIVEAWSDDEGRSWSKVTETTLPNPNSGTDAVTLKDGRALLVYNPTTRGRSPLHVAVSSDGKHWKTALVLENQKGEYSYPAVIQTDDGKVHITYTWKRELVKHVVLDPAKLQLKEID
jgi:predicted neuraminidase